jgi:hypothetical protein
MMTGPAADTFSKPVTFTGQTSLPAARIRALTSGYKMPVDDTSCPVVAALR